MYKRGGHKCGVSSQSRLAPSPFPSTSPSPSSNPQQLHIGGQHGHMRPSSNPQEHIEGQLGHMPIESTSIPCPSVPSTSSRSPLVPSPSSRSPSVPPSSMEQSNDERDTSDEDNRFMIRPYGDSFMEATYVVRQLNKIINNHWRGEWISYSSTPKEVKDLWWNEFKWKFKWDEIEEDEVKRVFKKKAGDHIRNFVNKAKKRKEKPDFITNENWAEMKRIWETEETKQRSEQNKRNRTSNSGEGSVTYAGGSVNIAEHRKRMADELGIEPMYTATFQCTFQRKDKTWIGDRAKAIKEIYDELLMAHTSGGSGGDGAATSEPSVDSLALWVEAPCGIKKGKIFGMGSMSRVYTTKGAGSSSSNAATSRRIRVEEQMTQELTQLKDLLREKDEEIRAVKQQCQSLQTQKDEEVRQMNERYNSLQAQTAFIFQHLNHNKNQVPPLHHVNQLSDGQNDDQQNDERHGDDEIADDDDFVAAAAAVANDDDDFLNCFID